MSSHQSWLPLPSMCSGADSVAAEFHVHILYIIFFIFLIFKIAFAKNKIHKVTKVSQLNKENQAMPHTVAESSYNTEMDGEVVGIVLDGG